jgi:hypothetical protein
MVFASVMVFAISHSTTGSVCAVFSAYDVALIDVSDAVVDWPECGNLGSTSVLTSPVLTGPNRASPATNRRHYTGYNTLNGTVSGQGAVPSHVNRSMHTFEGTRCR